ncbi:MAG TPA: hypothetical protein VIZ28_19970 [Chitinophagaceae bacterium]
MKIIPVILLLLPVCLAAQECKLKRTTDPYTKEIRLSTGLISLQGASLSVEADSKEIDFFFSVDGKEKCFNDASAAVIMYEGTKVKATFKNNGSMNCDGFFHIIFKNAANTNSLLQRLITQKIISIQFTGTDKKPITVNLSPEEQQKIMTRADCLVKEAKTLVK